MTPFNPQAQARSAANNAVSGLRSQIQSSPSFISGLLYVLGTVLVFGGLGLGACYSPLPFTNTFALLMGAFLLLGMLYRAYLPQWLKWHDPENVVQGGFILFFTALLGAGAIAALVFIKTLKPHSSPLGFTAAVIPFLLPFFFRESYRAWMHVPYRVYKLWYYQPNAPGPDLARMDLSNFMVVHFWMSRRFGERLYHDFSSKAPYEMRLKDLFTIFLNDYNAMKPEQALQYFDEQGRPYGWLFYAKQPWWKRRHYYDPDYTFRDNFLRQGSIIVAQRVPAADLALH